MPRGILLSELLLSMLSKVNELTVRLSLLTTLGFLYFTAVLTANAQYYQKDSLSTKLVPVRSYSYIKPVLGLIQSHCTIQGDKLFKTLPGADQLSTQFGLAVGYRNDRLEIESGLFNMPVVAGYHFPEIPYNPRYSISGLKTVQRITYTRVPLLFRYSVWRPSRRLEVQAVAGAAFNFELSKISLGQIMTSDGYAIFPDGTKQGVRTREESSHVKSFLTGEVGVGLHYQLGRRFAVHGQFSRVLSKKALLTKEVQVAPYNDPDTYQALATGSANGFSGSIGISYQFKLRERYRLALDH
jgi:hypothetical protein